jgi:hypothetical protein
MATDNAQPFRRMAERIDLNLDTEFAGALVIVPPQGGKPIEFLAINPDQDPAAFWGTAQAFVQRAMQQIEDQRTQGFAVR